MKKSLIVTDLDKLLSSIRFHGFVRSLFKSKMTRYDIEQKYPYVKFYAQPSSPTDTYDGRQLDGLKKLLTENNADLLLVNRMDKKELAQLGLDTWLVDLEYRSKVFVWRLLDSMMTCEEINHLLVLGSPPVNMSLPDINAHVVYDDLMTDSNLKYMNDILSKHIRLKG